MLTKPSTKPSTFQHRMVTIVYISEWLNHRISNILKKENTLVCIAHKSYTLRWALSHTSTECKYTTEKCPISNTRLCLRRNAVCQLTCNGCYKQYIGSMTHFIHDHVKEHLNTENSSVKKHIYSCLNKDYKCIEVKIIMSENDPANLCCYEAFYIRKCHRKK